MKYILISILTFFAITSYAQTPIYELDASHVDTIIKNRTLKVETHPKAKVQFSANSSYFIRDGKAWFPLMGEFHYNRYPQQYWEEEILKMKSAGLSIVATYIFWNAHENPKGVWNWEDNLDLKHFVELCQKNDMYVWLRIGPWSHGEQLYGGHPKWINHMIRKRTNRSKYIKEVKKLFEQIGNQTTGLYYNDGGPIIGVQLENEYASGQKGHIATLREIALEKHITPVYFSVTGNSVFNDKEYNTFPLQGSYPYRGWEKAGGTATADFLFGKDQWIMAEDFGQLYYELGMYPKGTCEQGCGSQLKYENRFIVEPQVVEAHLQNQMGRGMNLIGYYMFQGGTQMPGLKEKGYPESYDFQAPISEFGYLRPSYKYLKILHNFITDFGEDLAEKPVVYPENPVEDVENTDSLRYVARISGSSGYVFLGNTQVRINMPDKHFKLRLKLPDETIVFPQNDFLLKGQTTAILPINLYLHTALLKYATAQPMSRINHKDGSFLFLIQFDGTKSELAFDASTIKEMVINDDWEKEETSEIIHLTANNGHPQAFEITDLEGSKTTIVLLSREQAENSWRTTIDGQDYLMITKSDFMSYDDKIDLRQLSTNKMSIHLFPDLEKGLYQGNTELQAQKEDIFQKFDISVKKQKLRIKINKVSETKFNVLLPKELPNNISDIFLDINYLGGSATAKINGQIVTDNLFNGTSWLFGLKRYIKKDTAVEIEFEVLPWENNITGVAPELVKKIKEKGSQFQSINVIPQYRAILKLKDKAE